MPLARTAPFTGGPIAYGFAFSSGRIDATSNVSVPDWPRDWPSNAVLKTTEATTIRVMRTAASRSPDRLYVRTPTIKGKYAPIE